MHVVAIARLETSIEDEAQALAARLGTVAYDERRKLVAGTPAIVLSTPDEARAAAMLDELQARGHGALSCDTASVVSTSAMLSLRRFRFDDTALVAYTELADELPWQDVAALLPATHRTQTRTTTVVTDRRIAIGKALVTGGLAPTRTMKREVVTTTDAIEPVVYIFRRSAKPPWILQQHRAHYGALGDRLSPSAAPNFARAVDELVTRAPLARFDDRLMSRRASPEQLDLLAHLLATWIARDKSAYR